jgi:desulfoferrodoxin-like iron-binding protein
MSKEVKKAETKMKKAEKNNTYVCETCGCEVVCTTPGKGPLVCCGELMYPAPF